MFFIPSGTHCPAFTVPPTPLQHLCIPWYIFVILQPQTRTDIKPYPCMWHRRKAKRLLSSNRPRSRRLGEKNLHSQPSAGYRTQSFAKRTMRANLHNRHISSVPFPKAIAGFNRKSKNNTNRWEKKKGIRTYSFILAVLVEFFPFMWCRTGRVLPRASCSRTDRCAHIHHIISAWCAGHRKPVQQINVTMTSTSV